MVPENSGIKRIEVRISAHQIINQSENNIDQYAEDNHGCQWKVKPEIGSFNSNISGKPTNNLKLITKKIINKAH